MLSELSNASLSYRIKNTKYIKVYRFLSVGRNLRKKYGKQFSKTATKTGVDGLKAASNKVVDKATEAKNELIGNKIVDKILKSKILATEYSKND